MVDEVAVPPGCSRATAAASDESAPPRVATRLAVPVVAQAETNAKILMEAAEDLSKQLAELQEERQSARARLSAGVMVSDALKAQVANFDRVMKLDRARDEVEKAHALAEVYREDAGK